MTSIIKYKKRTNIIIIILNSLIIFDNLKIALLSECSYTHPFKKNGGDCIETGCSSSDIASNICIIENDIIKTQWLNNILDYSAISVNYATVSTTPKGNLICSSSFYNRELTLKYYFGLKNNGRPFFLENGKETLYSITDSDKTRNEGTIFGINLNGDKDNEYIIGYGINNFYLEVYDFKDNNNIIVYKLQQNKIFGVEYNSFQRSSIFKLKNCDKDYYIISFIAQASGGQKTFYIKKFLFTTLEFTSSSVVKSDSKISQNIAISSCFETDNNFIFCFYLNNNNKFIAIVYDQDINEKKSLEIAEAVLSSDKDFYKCVHFVGEAGAFLYFNSGGNIEIQFKQYIPEEIQSYFNNINTINIINDGYSRLTKLSDMISLADKKFCCIFMNSDSTEINLFIVNNYIDEKIRIRHYNIKINNLYYFKIMEELKINLYNDFISMAFTLKNSTGTFGSIVIYSYANSTDFDIDITDSLTSFTNPIINFYEKCKIENNIFGYIFKGIKIIDISEGYKVLSSEKKTEISINDENDIIYDNDYGELDFTEDINIEENGRIIFAMVLTEPEYEDFNQYPIEFDNQYCGGVCNDEKDNFNKKLYIGRHSYLDISINSEVITNNCGHIDEKCLLCIKNSNACVACKFSYKLSENNGKICLDEITSTLVDTVTERIISSTIITTVSTNIIVDTTSIPETNKESTYIIDDTTNKISEVNIESSITIDDTINDKNNCTKEQIKSNQCSEKVSIEQIEEIKNELLTQNYTKENIIIKTDNIILQLSTLEDQQYLNDQDISNIDLGECEERLRTIKNIPKEESLIICKTDVKIEDYSSKYVAYEVFDPLTLEKLDLSVCNDVKISINVPVTLNNEVEILYKSASDFGYNAFDENDSFYNDICTKYTTPNGTDILLSDRQEDIYTTVQSNNGSLCQTGCALQSYIILIKKYYVNAL